MGISPIELPQTVRSIEGEVPDITDKKGDDHDPYERDNMYFFTFVREDSFRFQGSSFGPRQRNSTTRNSLLWSSFLWGRALVLRGFAGGFDHPTDTTIFTEGPTF